MPKLYYYLKNGQVSSRPVPWNEIPIGADQAVDASCSNHLPPPWFPIHADSPLQQVAAYPQKNRWLYIVLAFFFGLLGIHNFYSGHGGAGAFKLILNLLLFWTIIVPLLIALIVLVEIFITDRDARGIAMSWK